MFRAAAIVFVLSVLLTTVASPTSTMANHEQGEPEHVFSGYVSLHREKLNDGFVRVTVGPGYGLQPPVQEVAFEDIRQGRYELAVVDPTRGKYSSVMLRFSVTYDGREYQRPRDVRLEPGKFTELNFDIEGWKWNQSQPQRVQVQPQRVGNPPGQDAERERERMERENEERRELDRERMEMEEEMRREQMEMERERMERDGEERREMERERMDRDEELRREQMDMERERMERDEEMRREQMAMSQQRMGRGQPGSQPVMNESTKSGPSRGLFSNRKAGEMTSGVDNIMDPAKLTIIGIVLTVLTTGMTLFKGN